MTFKLSESIPKKELSSIIDKSGLAGFTVTDKSLQSYYLETQMTEQKYENLEQPLDEPGNFLEQEFQLLVQDLKDSGLTVEDMGQQTPMNKSKVSFHSLKQTKQTGQQTE